MSARRSARRCLWLGAVAVLGGVLMAVTYVSPVLGAAIGMGISVMPNMAALIKTESHSPPPANPLQDSAVRTPIHGPDTALRRE